MKSNESHNGSLTVGPAASSSNDPSRSLSRSPHPYHRRSTSLLKAEKDAELVKIRYGGSSDSTESEDHGIEADDERGPILKGLPAPPLRGRKGLRGSKTPVDQTPAISPFPTPPALKTRRTSYFADDHTRTGSKLGFEEQDLALEAYQRYVKRRRAEIARRCTEGVLFTMIGTAACANARQNARFTEISHQVCSALGLLVVVCFLFPVRLAVQAYRSGTTLLTAVQTGLHIPSKFDPGPFIYPVFLPFFMAASLSSLSSDVLVTNIVLGLSSVPPKLMPYHGSHSLNPIHWASSLIPILVGTPSAQGLTPASLQSADLTKEDLALLFPLHQATLVTLRYLTSTSLEPAELQLLSTGMINLVLFTVHPQAEILKALLWLGALCIFVLCQKALSLEVAIARIPSWKFARNKSPRAGLLKIVENLFDMVLPKNPYKQAQHYNSEDEDYDYLKSARRRAKYQGRLRKARTMGPQSDLEPIRSDQEKEWVFIQGNVLSRSSTISAASNHSPIQARRRKSSLNNQPTGLLSLTYTQAQACKWLISIYVFSNVALTILVIVRRYVSAYALSACEPFGWAIGYLFGDIQFLRLWVVSNNLDAWIVLPSHFKQNVIGESDGWMERTRQTEVGPANMRLLISGYCIAVLITGIGVVLQLGTVVEVDTRRKVFHGMMVAMLLPTIFVDPCFIAMALSLILAIFLLLDLFRASQLPPISKPLMTFLAPYVDGRDHRGPVIVSPIFLLIGCAIPLWLSLAGASRSGRYPWHHWDTHSRELSMTSGVVCVGLGDAAASLVGRRYGRTKWIWSGGKSLEGSMAFALAVTVGLAASFIWLRMGGWDVQEGDSLQVALPKLALAGLGASLLESVLTAGNDNVIVPIGLWLLTRGLGI